MKSQSLFIILFLVGIMFLCSCSQDIQTLALRQVSSNSDWEPVIQTFDGVEMVLVPKGCYSMGSNTQEGGSPNSPVHEQCIENPFWIDRTEVTNAQFGSSGSFSGDKHPRDGATWYDALSHCSSRGVRLPTEVEWEYTARGPDGWIYPWGNTFIEDNTVFALSSEGETSAVGSHPNGASWVGAVDMGGNLDEWTHTIGQPYPYDPSDGREADADESKILTEKRVVRGGDFKSIALEISLTIRWFKQPISSYPYVGFRCAMDFSME